MGVKRRILCRVALGISIVGVVFTAGPNDHRAHAQQPIGLSPTEREAIRREMRTMERSLNRVLHGMADANPQMIEQAARASGKAIAIDVPLQKKLPAQYVALDEKVHLRFDQLADATKGGTVQGDVVPRLAAITGYCVACHDMFRVDERH